MVTVRDYMGWGIPVKQNRMCKDTELVEQHAMSREDCRQAVRYVGRCGSGRIYDWRGQSGQRS